jgi:hypothetical protein
VPRFKAVSSSLPIRTLYVCISLLPGTCHIPCPFPPCFDQHNIWQAVNIVTLIIMLEGSWFFFVMTVCCWSTFPAKMMLLNRITFRNYWRVLV